MSRYTLANCYKELNIGYLKIHSSFYSARSEEEMVRLRVNYIKKIFKYMMQGREIVYMDETSFNVNFNIRCLYSVGEGESKFARCEVSRDSEFGLKIHRQRVRSEIRHTTDF